MTTHNDDLSNFLSFDKTIISKLNWAVFFTKHHSLNKNHASHPAMCQIRIVPSLSPSLADEREARVRDW